MLSRAHVSGVLWIATSTAAWAIAVALYAAIVSKASVPFAVVNGAGIGFLIGVSEKVFLDGMFRRRLHRLPFTAVVLVRTAVCAAAWLTSAVVILSCVLASSEWSLAGIREVPEAADAFFDYVNSFRPTGTGLQVVVPLSLFFGFAWQVNGLLGKGVLLRYVLGRYHRPRTEERAFMFLDLNSATGIAERLGPEGYSAFLSEFFCDIGDAVLQASGEIVQYVGEEVVVTWTMRNAVRRNNCARLFFSVARRVGARRQEYIDRFGVWPEFKAGLHAGPVVVTEVGKARREIAYHGDTMNTASRIRSACHEVEADLLVSAALLRSLDLSEEYLVEELGPMQLPGKGDAVDILSVGQARHDAQP